MADYIQQASLNIPRDISQSRFRQQVSAIRLSNSAKNQCQKLGLLGATFLMIMVIMYDPQKQHLHPLFNRVGVSSGQEFNNTPVKAEQLAIFDEEILRIFSPFTDTDCQLEQWGQSRQDSHFLCKNHDKKSYALINVGVKNNDNFGCRFSSLYKVPNFIYDCKNNFLLNCPAQAQNNVYYDFCVGSQTGLINGEINYSFQDVLRNRNPLNRTIIAKMDCSGCEYDAFKSLRQEYLDFIDQLIVVFHLNPLQPEVWGALDIFRTLESKFVPVYFYIYKQILFDERTPNNRKITGNTFQVTLVNKDLIHFNSKRRSQSKYT